MRVAKAEFDRFLCTFRSEILRARRNNDSLVGLESRKGEKLLIEKDVLVDRFVVKKQMTGLLHMLFRPLFPRQSMLFPNIFKQLRMTLKNLLIQILKKICLFHLFQFFHQFREELLENFKRERPLFICTFTELPCQNADIISQFQSFRHL